jgi:hypothetical protein
MKYQILTTDQCQIEIDQINRAIQCTLHLHNIKVLPLDYVLYGRAIVTFTITRSLETLIVELIDPAPECAECDNPLPTIFGIDLTGDIFVDDDTLEAIAEHLIDHLIRNQFPCEAHPSERCSDCHLRPQPCSGREGV